MDYFQGVVTEYLRADRKVFLNTEFLINLDEGKTYAKGRHWYCDALALNFEERTAYLCEVTYSKTMQGLLDRLRAWAGSWPEVCEAIRRDSKIGDRWAFQPWVFIPEDSYPGLGEKLTGFVTSGERQMPMPRVTFLEKVTPWNYPSWDRRETALAEIYRAADNTDMTAEEVSEALEGRPGA
jgi:hypothetical protein